LVHSNAAPLAEPGGFGASAGRIRINGSKTYSKKDEVLDSMTTFRPKSSFLKQIFLCSITRVI
jgi:hypothetical protein